MKELGFGEVKPAAQPVLAPVSSGPSAPNGNGKKPTSWGAAVVQAILKTHLATTAAEAVRLLNESGLDANATPEQAIARLQSMRKD